MINRWGVLCQTKEELGVLGMGTYNRGILKVRAKGAGTGRKRGILVAGPT